MRTELLEALAGYVAFNITEESMREQMRQFVAEHANCFSRTLLIGHITSSCWVVDPARTQALLTWHKRLDRWLQMGGHVEDDPTLLASAERELREESGLQRIRAVSPAIFDLDIHPIPAKKAEPQHLHYDVRFLFEADPGDSLEMSEESREVAWVPLDEIAARNADASMLRMIEKTRRVG